MTGEEPEELNDGFDLTGADGMHHISLGAETREELGHATVNVIPHDGPVQSFDSVLVCELAGETSVVCKEAIEVEGEGHLIPTNIIPWGNIEAIVAPMDDGRLEQVDGELIGVNG